MPLPQPHFLFICCWDHFSTRRERRMWPGRQESWTPIPPLQLPSSLVSTFPFPWQEEAKVKDCSRPCQLQRSSGLLLVINKCVTIVSTKASVHGLTGPHALTLCTVIYIQSDHHPAPPPPSPFPPPHLTPRDQWEWRSLGSGVSSFTLWRWRTLVCNIICMYSNVNAHSFAWTYRRHYKITNPATQPL